MDEIAPLDVRRERAAKNESLFREVNERIEDLANSASFTTFICECRDESCNASVSVTIEEYERIRSDGDCFLVLPGHELAEIEQTIEATDRYLVVKKLGAGAAIAESLNPRTRSEGATPAT